MKRWGLRLVLRRARHEPISKGVNEVMVVEE
jgi:hypothetical protein